MYGAWMTSWFAAIPISRATRSRVASVDIRSPTSAARQSSDGPYTEFASSVCEVGVSSITRVEATPW